MKKWILTVAVGLMWLPVYAEKVEVTSDRMKAIDTKKEVHFIGNAKVKQGKNWITADLIVVYFNKKNQAEKYVATGKKKQAYFELDQETGFYKGHADKVTYDPNTSVYTLIGHAVVDDIENKRHLVGEKITINTLTGNADVVGKATKKGKRPVKFVFETKDSSKESGGAKSKKNGDKKKGK